MSFDNYSSILNKRNNKKSFWFGFIIFIIGVLLTFISLNIYVPTIIPDKIKILTLRDKKNILFLGVDEVVNDSKEKKSGKYDIWRGRSDTIVILSLDPYKNSIHVLNIPRDTRIKIDGYDIEKINYLNAIDGPSITKKHVERLLGIRIDNYVQVNLEGMVKFIDEIGGIIINVPQRMRYKDITGMVDINLFPGRQLLNGKQAVDFVRFRHDSMGDIGRVARQQAFIEALIKRTLDPIVFTRIPALLSGMNRTISTNLKPNEVVKIANFVRNVPTANRKIAMLPGKCGELNGVSYWIPTKKETLELVNEFFN